jgi:hypothetical protein
MLPKIREHFNLEISLARLAIDSNDPASAWRHLGRAHILGQFHAGPHLKVHWLMFVFGIKTRRLAEVFAQIPRLVLAAPGSWTKKAPVGNTGLSDVGIFQPLEIPDDLKKILKN